MDRSLFDRLVEFDRTRRSFPGEHWLALAAGLWFLRRKGGSLPSSLVSKAIGAALVARAASGRDGLQKLWQDGSGDHPATPSSAGRGPALGMGEGYGSTSTSPRAALLLPPDALEDRASPERSSAAGTGGYPDFR